MADVADYTLFADQKSAPAAMNRYLRRQIQLQERFRNSILLDENSVEKAQKPSGSTVRSSQGKPKMVERGSESSKAFFFRIANTSVIFRGILLQKNLMALKNLY